MSKPRYIGYKITNNITHEYYFGVCTSKTYYYNKTNPYYGSSKRVHTACLQYGRENFSREVIATAETPAQAEWIERQVVTPRAISDPQCYNQQVARGIAKTFKKAMLPAHAEKMRKLALTRWEPTHAARAERREENLSADDADGHK